MTSERTMTPVEQKTKALDEQAAIKEPLLIRVGHLDASAPLTARSSGSRTLRMLLRLLSTFPLVPAEIQRNLWSDTCRDEPLERN